MKWQMEYGKEIIAKYNEGVDVVTLSVLFGIGKNNIRHFLKKYNNDNWRSRRIYTLNENYFKDIDNQNKAYILGFICADGHISEKSGYEGISIEIQSRDIEVLEFLKTELKTNKPIKDSIKQNKTYKYIKILSTKIRKDFNKLDIYHNKTTTLKFPKISQDLIPHFIRGYNDGDGCIFINDKKPAHSYVSIVANNLMCNDLKENIEKLGITAIIRKGNSEVVSCVCIYGQLQMERFLDYIYTNANFYLKRKFLKYKQLKSNMSIYSREKHFKLSKNNLNEIREKLGMGYTIESLAKEYNISTSPIVKIKHGKYPNYLLENE